MSKFSMIAFIAASIGLAGAGPAVAKSNGMGDPSAHMRADQAVCDAQRRGEYPRYHDACLPDYPTAPVRH